MGSEGGWAVDFLCKRGEEIICGGKDVGVVFANTLRSFEQALVESLRVQRSCYSVIVMCLQVGSAYEI